MPEIANIQLNSVLKDAVDTMIHGTGLTSRDNGDNIEIIDLNNQHWGTVTLAGTDEQGNQRYKYDSTVCGDEVISDFDGITNYIHDDMAECWDYQEVPKGVFRESMENIDPKLRKALVEAYHLCHSQPLLTEGVQYQLRTKWLDDGDEHTDKFDASNPRQRDAFARKMALIKHQTKQLPKFGHPVQNAQDTRIKIPERIEHDNRYTRFDDNTPDPYGNCVIPTAIRKRVDSLIKINGWPLKILKLGERSEYYDPPQYDTALNMQFTKASHENLPTGYEGVIYDHKLTQEITDALAPLGFSHTEGISANEMGNVDSDSVLLQTWTYQGTPQNPKLNTFQTDRLPYHIRKLLPSDEQGAFKESLESVNPRLKKALVEAYHLCHKRARIESESSSSKKKWINRIYVAAEPYTKGLKRDNNWENVWQLFDVIKKAVPEVSFDVGTTDGGYVTNSDGMKSKVYNITGQTPEGFPINGQLVCSFCGPSDDPESCYDMALILN